MVHKENEIITNSADVFWLWESKLSPELCDIVISEKFPILFTLIIHSRTFPFLSLEYNGWKLILFGFFYLF
jgi:hypothetical protein